jgi:AbiV family abortive infection protein
MKPLSIEQLEDARSKVLANAEHLFAEAELLFQNGRWARSYGLAQLCSEELAKLPMLARAISTLILGRPVDWKLLGKRLRNHSDKINLLHYQEALPHPLSLEFADEAKYEASRERTPDINRRKNESLYAGITDAGFASPSESVSEEESRGLMALTRERLERFRFLEGLTAGRMVELFSNPEARSGLETLFSEFEA